MSFETRVLDSGTIAHFLKKIEDEKELLLGALVDSWNDINGTTNPYFEISSEGSTVSVLLLVKELEDEKWSTLYLVGDSFGWDIPSYQFAKINGTSWWFITFERPNGARLHYMISPNDSGTKIEPKIRNLRYSNFRIDPRNPLTLYEGHQTHSVIQTPGFGIHQLGLSRELKFHSLELPEGLEGRRSAQYLILGNNPTKLLITHDGAAFSKIMQGHRILDRGVQSGRWPSMVLLSLNCSVRDRVEEYGGREDYPRYFSSKIIPSLEREIGLTFTPEDIVLYGSSLGAWGMLDIVMRSPNSPARHLILQSCPFWWPDLDHQKYIRMITQGKQINVDRLFIDVGIYETGRVPMSTYNSNIAFANAIALTNIDFMANEFLMGHRYNSWAWSFPTALDFILSGTSREGKLPSRKLGSGTL